jgi:hypothetical protein
MINQLKPLPFVQMVLALDIAITVAIILICVFAGGAV